MRAPTHVCVRVCVFPGANVVFNPVFALQSLSWRASSRGSTADTASTSRCCRMAPWKAQRTKAAPSVSELSDTLRCCQLVWWRCVFHSSASTFTTGSFPCFHARGYLKRDFPGRTVVYLNVLTAHECKITLPCFLVWFTLGSIRLKMHAHLARCTGRTPAKWDLFTLRNISQGDPGTDWVFQTHVSNCFVYNSS